jgi:hypothetical protein
MVWSRRWMLGCAALVAGVGCIIPDNNIQVRGDFVNPGPVRIVQAVPISDQANEACARVSELTDCPLLPPTVPLGLLGADTTFCVCPEADNNALLSFDLYVEDPDVVDGKPEDTILAALLLDMPESEEDPSTFVAFTNLLSGTEPATNVQLGFGGYQDSFERPTPLVRSWTLGRDSGVDLCNDNSGEKLDPGTHSLRIVVTDRPWYRPVLRDAKGEPVVESDVIVRVEDEASAKIGVPDTPAGASYAIADYVFVCGDGTDPDNPSPGCNCALPEPE